MGKSQQPPEWLETVDTESLLEEILSSANALKEAVRSQKDILDTVALTRLDRVMVHKNVLIDKIRAIHQVLKDRGIDFAEGMDCEGTTSRARSDGTDALRKTVGRTIRDILRLEADSQRRLLSLKQHVRGILLDIQERRRMLRGYAAQPSRYARVLDTKS
jgi:hypothetical protein